MQVELELTRSYTKRQNVAAGMLPGSFSLEERQHSLLHGLATAKCSTPWEEMADTGHVRTCPKCKKTVIDATGLDEPSVAKLVAEAEPHRKVNEIALYRRSDGRLMTSKSNCYLAKLADFYYSWPIVLTLGASSAALTLLADQDGNQGYVIAFAFNMTFSLLLVFIAAREFFGLDLSLRGRLPQARAWLGSVSTLVIAVYAIVRMLNIPVWDFDKGVLNSLYIGSISVGSFLLFIAKSNRYSKNSQIAKTRSGTSTDIPSK